MDDQNQSNTRCKVHLVNPPPPITSTYRQALLDLTGLDVNGPVADEAAQAMKACHFVESEILAVMYLRAVQTIQQVCQQTLNRAAEDKPLSVFDAAMQVRDQAQCQLAKRLEQLRDFHRNSKNPDWSSTDFKSLKLNAECSYTLTNDARNAANLEVLVGADGSPNILKPGATLDLKSVDAVEVRSDTPCLMQMSRTGGQYRTGSLEGCLPLPRRNLTKPIEPTPPPPKKKFLGLW